MLDLTYQLLSSLSLCQVMNSGCIHVVQVVYVIGRDHLVPVHLLERLLSVDDRLCLGLCLSLGG
jgi:hypothetical protein